MAQLSFTDDNAAAQGSLVTVIRTLKELLDGQRPPSSGRLLP